MTTRKKNETKEATRQIKMDTKRSIPSYKKRNIVIVENDSKTHNERAWKDAKSR